MNYKYMQQHEQIENMLREESIEQNSSYIEAKHTKNYIILLEQRQVHIQKHIRLGTSESWEGQSKWQLRLRMKRKN